MTMVSYGEALSNLPLWAIEQAVSGYRRGTWGDPRFVPKPPELAIHVRTIVAPFREERALIERVLNAEIIPAVDEAARARAQARATEVISGFARQKELDHYGRPRSEKEEAQSFVKATERFLKDAIPTAAGVKISPEMAKKLAGYRAENEQRATLDALQSGEV